MAAHAGRTAAPVHGHAKPARRQAHGSQQHHGEARGRAKSPGATAATRSPWINRLGYRGVGEEQQRRGKADQRGSIEAPSNGGSIDTDLAGGDGRWRPEHFGEGSGDHGVAREKGRLGFASAWGRKGSVRPTEPKWLGLGLTR